MTTAILDQVAGFCGVETDTIYRTRGTAYLLVVPAGVWLTCHYWLVTQSQLKSDLFGLLFFSVPVAYLSLLFGASVGERDVLWLLRAILALQVALDLAIYGWMEGAADWGQVLLCIYWMAAVVYLFGFMEWNSTYDTALGTIIMPKLRSFLAYTAWAILPGKLRVAYILIQSVSYFVKRRANSFQHRRFAHTALLLTAVYITCAWPSLYLSVNLDATFKPHPWKGAVDLLDDMTTILDTSRMYEDTFQAFNLMFCDVSDLLEVITSVDPKHPFTPSHAPKLLRCDDSREHAGLPPPATDYTILAPDAVSLLLKLHRTLSILLLDYDGWSTTTLYPLVKEHKSIISTLPHIREIRWCDNAYLYNAPGTWSHQQLTFATIYIYPTIHHYMLDRCRSPNVTIFRRRLSQHTSNISHLMDTDEMGLMHAKVKSASSDITAWLQALDILAVTLPDEARSTQYSWTSAHLMHLEAKYKGQIEVILAREWTKHTVLLSDWKSSIAAWRGVVTPFDDRKALRWNRAIAEWYWNRLLITADGESSDA